MQIIEAVALNFSSSSPPIFFLLFLYLFVFIHFTDELQSHQSKACGKKNDEWKSSHMYLFIVLVNGGRIEYGVI